jgi:hypothetical protein
MSFASHSVISALVRVLCILVFLVPLGCDDSDDPISVVEIEYDFVADREFPADSNNGESLPEFEFAKSGISIRATAADDEGMAANVSRRGPGGLGVVGSGGMEPDGGETSGNRINNGELLQLEILDAAGNSVSAQLVDVTFSRIKQFADHFETGFEIIADNDGAFAVEIEGTLDAESVEFVGEVDVDDNVLIDIEDVGLFGGTFIFTNGRPFHETANRFRVSGITILIED